jgi:hypothetical protein
VHSRFVPLCITMITVLLASGVCFGQSEWVGGDSSVFALNSGSSISPNNGTIIFGGGAGLFGHLNFGVNYQTFKSYGATYSGETGYLEYLVVKSTMPTFVSAGIAASVGSFTGGNGFFTMGGSFYFTAPIGTKAAMVLGYNGSIVRNTNDEGSAFQNSLSEGMSFRISKGLMLVARIEEAFANGEHQVALIGSLAFSVGPHRKSAIW